jgi:alpha-aminoadipate carrier protein LysW
MSSDASNGTCPVCDGTMTIGNDIVVSEIVRCSECGSELEVRGLSPLEFAEAPMEEEDWGQ